MGKHFYWNPHTILSDKNESAYIYAAWGKDNMVADFNMFHKVKLFDCHSLNSSTTKTPKWKGPIPKYIKNPVE